MRFNNFTKLAVCALDLLNAIMIVKILGSKHPILAFVAARLIWDEANSWAEDCDVNKIGDEYDDWIYEITDGKFGKKMDQKETETNVVEFGFH